MGRYIGLPHSSQTQRRPIDRPARTKRVKLGTWCSWVVIFTPRALYPLERTLVPN